MKLYELFTNNIAQFPLKELNTWMTFDKTYNDEFYFKIPFYFIKQNISECFFFFETAGNTEVFLVELRY